MASKSFDKSFLDHYRIDSFFKPEKKGGQKTVCFPMIDGEKQVMKIYTGGKDPRFEREMKIYDQFKDSTGIPNVYRFEEYHGEIVLFEEYIDGDTLSDITGNYSGNDDMIKKFLLEMFSILTPVWNAKYVHRDIKPDNIMIRSTGELVVLDFGIARDLDAGSITGTGTQPATWLWAAPEQFQGDKDLISYRTDFFSIGVLTYYLYYQQLPFGSTHADIDLRYKSSDEAFVVDAGCSLNNFLKEALHFKPAHRPRHISDLIKLI